jgi:hypothetical protein
MKPALPVLLFGFPAISPSQSSSGAELRNSATD